MKILTTKLGFTEVLQTSLKYRPKQRTDQSLCRSKNLKEGEEMKIQNLQKEHVIYATKNL